jgi:hypothetical protein
VVYAVLKVASGLWLKTLLVQLTKLFSMRRDRLLVVDAIGARWF